MPVDLPSWVADRPDATELIDEYGRTFLAMFRDGAHLKSFLSTGSLALPESIRRRAAARADSIKAQRKVLLDRCGYAKAAIRNAKRRIEAAQAALDAPNQEMYRFRHEETIRGQSVRIEERAAALRRAEIDFELFCLFHSTKQMRRH